MCASDNSEWPIRFAPRIWWTGDWSYLGQMSIHCDTVTVSPSLSIAKKSKCWFFVFTWSRSRSLAMHDCRASLDCFAVCLLCCVRWFQTSHSLYLVLSRTIRGYLLAACNLCIGRHCDWSGNSCTVLTLKLPGNFIQSLSCWNRGNSKSSLKDLTKNPWDDLLAALECATYHTASDKQWCRYYSTHSVPTLCFLHTEITSILFIWLTSSESELRLGCPLISG